MLNQQGKNQEINSQFLNEFRTAITGRLEELHNQDLSASPALEKENITLTKLQSMLETYEEAPSAEAAQEIVVQLRLGLSAYSRKKQQVDKPIIDGFSSILNNIDTGSIGNIVRIAYDVRERLRSGDKYRQNIAKVIGMYWDLEKMSEGTPEYTQQLGALRKFCQKTLDECVVNFPALIAVHEQAIYALMIALVKQFPRNIHENGVPLDLASYGEIDADDLIVLSDGYVHDINSIVASVNVALAFQDYTRQPYLPQDIETIRRKAAERGLTIGIRVRSPWGELQPLVPVATDANTATEAGDAAAAATSTADASEATAASETSAATQTAGRTTASRSYPLIESDEQIHERIRNAINHLNPYAQWTILLSHLDDEDQMINIMGFDHLDTLNQVIKYNLNIQNIIQDKKFDFLKQITQEKKLSESHQFYQNQLTQFFKQAINTVTYQRHFETDVSTVHKVLLDAIKQCFEKLGNEALHAYEERLNAWNNRRGDHPISSFLAGTFGLLFKACAERYPQQLSRLNQQDPDEPSSSAENDWPRFHLDAIDDVIGTLRPLSWSTEGDCRQVVDSLQIALQVLKFYCERYISREHNQDYRQMFHH